ncbi:MAG TPA: hypothetical protein VK701_06210 [Solirubrobacteraceae bacterium]|jgi:hypothetical protein|nr:hypothetical protein [Solirubrobacteraceae bacterium]
MKAIGPIAGLVALALLAAGCGGGSKSPTVAHLGSSTTPSTSSSSSSAGSGGASSSAGSPHSQAVAYSACMREHGVANFPDPQISTSGNEVKVAMRVTPGITGNPHFQSAEKACSKLLPEGGPGGPGANRQISPREQSQYLKAAACIRTHGIPNFPDPTFSGGGVHVSQKGINLHSPQARAAEEACQSLIPGGLHGNH